jgi:hypothetical protein
MSIVDYVEQIYGTCLIITVYGGYIWKHKETWYFYEEELGLVSKIDENQIEWRLLNA